MSDLIEEIKEDVKVEKIIIFFKRYANHLIALILIAGVGAGGYLFWQNQKEKERLAQSGLFFQAQKAASEGHDQEARQFLSQLASGKTTSSTQGYSALALFQQALLDSTSPEDKRRLYLEIADNTKIDAKFRDLGVILWAYEGIDQEDVTALHRKLVPLTQGKSPWHDSAQELLALTDIRAGETKNALQRLKYLLSNEETTPGIRRRALALFEQLSG